MTSKHILDNGLTVILDEDHSSPVAALLTHVRTGYFSEADEHAGISHLLEHMFFKGTPKRPGPEDISRATKSLGGVINAYTYYDETGYYSVVPSTRLDDALEIQSDALANTLLDAEQLRLETEVVIQESQQKKDAAWSYATESLFALAFQQHRMRRWRIGEPDVLRSLTRNDVLAYYRGTYRPENMVLVVSGDFDAHHALEAVRRYYGGIVGGPPYMSPGPAEPAQTSPRFAQMRGDIQQRLILAGFHAVPILHEDGYALDVLSAILAGSRTSRLFLALREKTGLATALQAYNMGFRDIGYFVIALESLTDDFDATENALWAEIRRLQETPPRADEMERIRTQMRSRWVFDGEDAMGRARRLASFEALGDFRLAETYFERLQNVTAEAVSDVATRYLRRDNASLLEYIPRSSPVRPLLEWPIHQTDPSLEEGAAPNVYYPAYDGSQARSAAAPPGRKKLESRFSLPGGGLLAARRSGNSPVVAIEILWPGGLRHEHAGNSGISNLALHASLKGTATRTAEEFAAGFESLGTRLNWIYGADYWGYAFRVLNDRFEEALGLFADVLHNAAFDPEEVAREKEAISAEIRRSFDNSMDRSLDLLDEAAYGTHPYGLPERGSIASLQEIRVDDLKAWHERMGHTAPFVGAAGAMDPERIRAVVSHALNTSGTGLFFGDGKAPEGLAGVVERVETRDRNQTAASIGFFTVPADSDDRFALDALASVLSGLGGRLFAEVRGRQGLAYTVSAWHTVRKDAGMFTVYTATDPGNEDRARASIFDELEKVRQDLVTAEELDRVRTFIAGAKSISLQASFALASDLCRNAVYGRPEEASDYYVQRIQSLTREDLQDAAQRYLLPDRYAAGILRGKT